MEAMNESRQPLVDEHGIVDHERFGEIERIAYAGYLTYAEAGQMLRECTKAIKTMVILNAALRAGLGDSQPRWLPAPAADARV